MTTRVAQNYEGTNSVGANSAAINPNSSFPVIELHVAAKGLADMDIITVSDPICVLFIRDTTGWREIGRTEVVWNNLNPEWVKYFTIQYVFENRQLLMFRVYDVDSDNCNLSAQDFIGEAEIELSQILSSAETTVLELKRPGKSELRGTLYVTHEQAENSASVIEAEIRGVSLRKMGWIFSNNPFFVISKSSEAGRFVPVVQSEVAKNMRWKKFNIPYQQLCNCDPDRPIRITFMNYNSFSAATPIGYFETTYARLSESLGKTEEVRNQSGEEVGSFVVRQIQLHHKFNFYDFLRGGVQLNLVTAIDFTGSNGNPASPQSLHYISNDGINQYEKCIRAVGEVLCPYDSDQMFPVYGFGAEVNYQVSHCFPLNNNPDEPSVHGLDGILEVYRRILSTINLYGPTKFAPVIRNASALAQESWQESKTYTILLIITDGQIDDMEDTTDAIVAAGRLPLSIIIVGVGNADFSAMDVLDADDNPLISRSGYVMERDLVQFVPFNKFARSHYSVLAAEVLDEVPRQLVEWAELNGIKPG